MIVWATKGQSFSYFNDIHGQIYDRYGNTVGGEFRVNSTDIPGVNETPSSNTLHPSVAMDDNGSFVVAWDAPIDEKSGVIINSVIMARVFDAKGNPIAVNGNNTEFRVNVGDTNFTSDQEHDPHVDAVGDGQVSIYSRLARNAQVSMDSEGNFIVTWEAFQDNDVVNSPDTPESYGIYFRRFYGEVTDSSGNSLFGQPESAADAQANLTVTAGGPAGYTLEQSAPWAGDQVNPSIAMDADGDYTIVWDGNGADSDPLDPTDLSQVYDNDPQGVWVRSFHAKDPLQTEEEAVTMESRVNLTQPGTQQFGSVAMTPDGSYVVVWSGNGVGDFQGVFFRRYVESSQTAGPMAVQLLSTDGTQINSEIPLATSPSQLVVTFDENLAVSDPAALAAAIETRNTAVANNQPIPSSVWSVLDTVNNPENWELSLNGIEIPNAVASVQFALNPATNKYQATLTLTQALPAGNYTLTALHPILDATGTETRSGIRDTTGNALGLTGFTEATDGQDSAPLAFAVARSGSDTSVTGGASVSNARTYPESPRAVAVNGEGDSIVVYSAHDAATNLDRVYVAMYNADGTVSTAQPLPFAVTSTAAGNQRYATVACDGDGDFVVTWTQYDSPTDANVYGRRFNAVGQAQGNAFEINTYTANNQKWSNVAMDTAGDFVVTWSSYGQEDNGQLGSGYGVYARRYDSFGSPLARVSGERHHGGEPAGLERGHGRQRRLRHRLGERPRGRCGQHCRPRVQRRRLTRAGTRRQRPPRQ